VILALLLVVCCAFAVFRLSLRSKLNARIEAIRAAGYPVTCVELDQWYAIPDGAENAADTIMDALSFRAEPHYTQFVPMVGPVELPARTEPLAEDTRGFTALYIVDNRKALELLHAAAAIEHCRYPIDLSAGHEVVLSDLSSLKKCVQLLNLEAVSHVEDDPNLSARSVISALGVARSFEKEPIIVCQLVRIACQASAVSTLEYLVNRADFTDEQLKELNQAVVEAQARTGMVEAFVGERCMFLQMLRMPPAQIAHGLSIMNGRYSPKSNAGAHLMALALTLRKFAGLTDRSTIICLDIMADYVEAIQLPVDRRRQEVEAISARSRAAVEADFLLRQLLPVLARVNTIDLRRIAYLRVGNAALAIQRHRLAAGELPETLADLVPTYLDAVPGDPFDGNDLRYEKLGHGFVVYSIGEDLSDDGGKEKLPGSGKARNWDVTFIVER
jgi:hypothetical protein